MSSLDGKVLLLSGGSRGIGLAIALRAARDGAAVALLAKTATPHPRLEGTVHTAAAAIEAAGGEALPIVGDVRDEGSVDVAVAATIERFGAIDIVVNNASAIDLSPSLDLAARRYDLMQAINARGAFLLARAAVPHLRRAANPHVLTLSPPLSFEPRWLGAHLGYTISKYSMSLVTLGMAAEFEADGIAFNSLWPRTLIATAAVRNVVGGEAALARARKPAIVADAAHAILTRPAGERNGELLLDEDVLREAGVEDFAPYAVEPGSELELDLFVTAEPPA
ncbi:MAG: NAD(P)-dependent oxidoreductase [Actinobacteria bacterium]|nr:NAD(P)-dependent oxidoreductase [Actinomycetota bacterium]OJU83849.1 MAG: short chain dehydrogenase [Solirubrobacterales bacterium 70-9]